MRRKNAGDTRAATLDELRERLTGLLRRQFTGADIRWDTDDRLVGLLIWQGFEGYSQTERQRRLWETLRREVPLDDQSRILGLLTVTPSEQRVMDREIE